MSRRYGLTGLPSPPVITIASRCAVSGAAMNKFGFSVAQSGTSPWSDAVDNVLAFPFTLEVPTTIYKVFWVNGTSVGGTADVAVFDEDYNFMVGTGAATACTGSTSTPQTVALTATTRLPPGRYYAGMTKNDTTTNRVFRWSVLNFGVAALMAMGCWKSADAGPINLNATPTDLTNIAFPLFGLITRSVFDV